MANYGKLIKFLSSKNIASTKLTPAEQKYIEEIMESPGDRAELADRVPSFRYNPTTKRSMTTEEELEALIDYIDESVALRNPGERLPPSFNNVPYSKTIPGRATLPGKTHQSNTYAKADRGQSILDEMRNEMLKREYKAANSVLQAPQGVNRTNKTDLSKAEKAFGDKIK